MVASRATGCDEIVFGLGKYRHRKLRRGKVAFLSDLQVPYIQLSSLQFILTYFSVSFIKNDSCAVHTMLLKSYQPHCQSLEVGLT